MVRGADWWPGAERTKVFTKAVCALGEFQESHVPCGSVKKTWNKKVTLDSNHGKTPTINQRSSELQTHGSGCCKSCWGMIVPFISWRQSLKRPLSWPNRETDSEHSIFKKARGGKMSTDLSFYVHLSKLADDLFVTGRSLFLNMVRMIATERRVFMEKRISTQWNWACWLGYNLALGPVLRFCYLYWDLIWILQRYWLSRLHLLLLIFKFLMIALGTLYVNLFWKRDQQLHGCLLFIYRGVLGFLSATEWIGGFLIIKDCCYLKIFRSPWPCLIV